MSVCRSNVSPAEREGPVARGLQAGGCLRGGPEPPQRCKTLGLEDRYYVSLQQIPSHAKHNARRAVLTDRESGNSLRPLRVENPEEGA